MKIYSHEEITKKLNKRQIRKNLIKIIFYPIIILVLVCNLSLIMQKIKNPEKIASIFGYKAFIIVSGSMEPNLKVGDIVIIKETMRENIEKDDIITFLENGHAITHRVSELINKEGQICYETKGDNNTSKDAELVEYENIEGEYVLKIEKVGLIISRLQNSVVIIPIIIIMYIIYKIISKKDDRREARHEKRKEIEKKEKDLK